MLTGESVPVEVGPDDQVVGATVNVGGRIVALAPVQPVVARLSLQPVGAAAAIQRVVVIAALAGGGRP